MAIYSRIIKWSLYIDNEYYVFAMWWFQNKYPINESDNYVEAIVMLHTNANWVWIL